MESPAAALSVVACVTLILDGLLKAIAAKSADYPFTGEMVTFLWKRVNTVKNRFLSLAALIAAGKTPRERRSKPRARKRGSAVGADGINWRKWLPMSRFAWLCRLMPSLANHFGAAQFAEQLRHQLGRAEMRALLAATPKTGRLLAPLCFMLGIEESLLRVDCAAPPPLPTPAFAASETVAPEPRAAGLESVSALLSPGHPPLGRLDRPPDPGGAVFVPA